ncbi:MAG: ATP-binding protein [SAR202 cluster bacterium]|nr:ATP-binding protein [SAR202 cluster bacterium]|tara:strand:- start:34581 stop:36188 length:1608 start_codon:yes stop_codon:yes gene_type:complete
MNKSNQHANQLGLIIGGSISQGLDVRFSESLNIEQTKIGTFVTISGINSKFFGTVTDLRLDATDSKFSSHISTNIPGLSKVLSDTTVYSLATITPSLNISEEHQVPQPAKSLPPHFSPVFRASNEDVAAVFGSEDHKHIWIGSPLDMEDARVCLNLEDFVKRSNAVFGKSGTGKSFLTRILLSGILQRQVATNLIFDMHNEYGWESSTENGYSAKGLKQLFGSRVTIFTLDKESADIRGIKYDNEAQIGFDEIEPEDIAILASTLNITELGIQSCYALADYFKKDTIPWILKFLELTKEELNDLADHLRENTNTLEALRRNLSRLKRFSFMAERSIGKGITTSILENLMDNRHVVLEFGKHGDNESAYILVANLITRRIHEEYRKKTEAALAGNTDLPRPLVITIEEAHRFLNSGVASHTIFGTIAREMRKYRVTLLVVDQRPSGIDEEILSQIGTRIVCQLDNDRDIDAVLTAAAGSRNLRNILSRLESMQQSLMFGHAIPMPVVVKTRNYGSDFYSDITLPGFGNIDKKDLFG